MRKEKLGLSDLNNIRKRLLRELDISFFEDRFNKATPIEQDVLLAMAGAGSEKVRPSEMLKNVEVEKPHLFNYLTNLMDKNRVYRVSNRGEATLFPFRFSESF